MHISVCVKQTPDSASVYIDPLSGQIDRERFVEILNPADACAIEAAIRLKEQLGGVVVVYTVGPYDAEGVLRAALALGADTVIRIWNAQATEWGPFTIAAALAACMQNATQSPDLVMCGAASSDWASSAVGPALAHYLNLPQITGIAQAELVKEQEPITLQLKRKLERGYRELLEAELPLLLTVTSDLNEPRYPSLPAHLAALKAKITVLDPQTLAGTIQLNEADETILLEMHTPRPRPRHVATPNSKHSAYQRIGEIITGGGTGRQTRLEEGSPEELARTLTEFLRGKGFV